MRSLYHNKRTSSLSTNTNLIPISIQIRLIQHENNFFLPLLNIAKKRNLTKQQERLKD